MSGGATGQYAVLGASGEEGQSASAAQYKAGLARKAGAGNHSAYNTLKPTIISVHDFMHPGTGRVVQIITMQDAKVREGSREGRPGRKREGGKLGEEREQGHLRAKLCPPHPRRAQHCWPAGQGSLCAPPAMPRSLCLPTTSPCPLPALVQNAVDHFDLSAAATWFDGDMLRTKYPATTDKGQMFWMHEDRRMGPRHDK